MQARRHPAAIACARRAAAAAALAAAGALAHAQQPVVVQALECRGDDASWRLDAGRSTATYSAPGPRGKRETVFRGSLQTMSIVAPPAIVWRGDSTHLPRETLVAVVRDETCPAGAGAPSSQRVVLSLRAGEAATGCCTVRSGFDARVAPAADFGAKKQDDWARQLPELAPAVAACVSRAGARAKAVAKAWPAQKGTVGVRIVETAGGALDCVAETSGRGTPALAAVNPADPPLPGAGNPLLYPPREPPPIVACGRLERAQGARGALLGYLHYDPC